MENPKNTNTTLSHFVLFSLESVQESLRRVSSRTPLCETEFWLPLRIETWLAPRLLPKPLPWRLSTPLFTWILLEANLGLGSLQSSLPRLVDQFLKLTQGNPAPFLWYRTGFDAPRDPWEGFVEIFFPLLLACDATLNTQQWYQSTLVCIKIGSLLRVFGFWYPCFHKVKKMRFLV